MAKMSKNVLTYYCGAIQPTRPDTTTFKRQIIYKELRDRIIAPPTAQFKYNDLFENNVLDWKQIYSLPHRVTLDTKPARISI